MNWNYRLRAEHYLLFSDSLGGPIIVWIFRVVGVSLFSNSMMAFVLNSGKLETKTDSRKDHMKLIFHSFQIQK